MGRKYKNPPVIEAVFEIRFTRDTPWDLTIPGLFYEKVKNTFPVKEQTVFQEGEIIREPHGLIQEVIRSGQRILLFTEDRKMLTQLGPYLLAINVLKPYPTWQNFKEKIELAWKGLNEIIEIKGIERVILAYINQIEIPIPKIQLKILKNYFNFYPFIDNKFPEDLASFIVGCEFPYKEGKECCSIQLVSMPDVSKEQKTLMLNISYFTKQPRAVEVSNILDWVENAHDQIQKAFESCISDNLRTLFEEVK